jgi:hypothetical protein
MKTNSSNLLNNLKIEKTVSGGSVANSIVGLSQLGDEGRFLLEKFLMTTLVANMKKV